MTNKRPGFDHGTKGPMRGLKTYMKRGQNIIYIKTDIATTRKKSCSALRLCMLGMLSKSSHHKKMVLDNQF